MGAELDILKGKTLLLASASPRRKELLANLGIRVEQARLKEVDESYPHEIGAHEVAPFISRKKAQAYMGEIAEDEILVTADTVVLCNSEVLGKPADKLDAKKMLSMLSGHSHTVVTGVTLVSNSRFVTFAEETEVEFARLTPGEIDYYVERCNPVDKAGAYGIQEWIGYIGITGIKGDYYNVMGLPLHSLYRHLKALVGEPS